MREVAIGADSRRVEKPKLRHVEFVVLADEIMGGKQEAAGPQAGSHTTSSDYLVLEIGATAARGAAV
jgi:hypothetical protein